MKQKALQLSRSVREYFDRNPSVGRVRPQDLMPWLGKQGLFSSEDVNANSLRAFLHRLSEAGLLPLVPYVVPEVTTSQVRFTFVRRADSGGSSIAPPQRIQRLGPVLGPDIEGVVVGFAPDKASWAAGCYYASPNDQFWPLMQHHLNLSATDAPLTRQQALLEKGIGLWYLMASPVGTTPPQPNAIGQLKARAPRLRIVFANGREADQLLQQLAPELPGVVKLALPNSAPTQSVSNEVRLQEWQAIRLAVTEPKL